MDQQVVPKPDMPGDPLRPDREQVELRHPTPFCLVGEDAVAPSLDPQLPPRRIPERLDLGAPRVDLCEGPDDREEIHDRLRDDGIAVEPMWWTQRSA
jgi:hypothetical protein